MCHGTAHTSLVSKFHHSQTHVFGNPPTPLTKIPQAFKITINKFHSIFKKISSNRTIKKFTLLSVYLSCFPQYRLLHQLRRLCHSQFSKYQTPKSTQYYPTPPIHRVHHKPPISMSFYLAYTIPRSQIPFYQLPRTPPPAVARRTLWCSISRQNFLHALDAGTQASLPSPGSLWCCFAKRAGSIRRDGSGRKHSAPTAIDEMWKRHTSLQ